jgi:hypothetical protein
VGSFRELAGRKVFRSIWLSLRRDDTSAVRAVLNVRSWNLGSARFFVRRRFGSACKFGGLAPVEEANCIFRRRLAPATARRDVE